MTRAAKGALAAVLLLLPLLLLWPGPQSFLSEVLTHPEREGAAHIWGLWAGGFYGNPLIAHSPELSFPDGFELVVVDPGQVPLYWLFGWLGPAAGYNGLLWINLIICGLAGAALAQREQAQPALGAALAMACPTLLASAAEGTTEDFAVGWVLVQLVLMLRLIDAPSWRRAVPFAGALAMASYCGPYNGIWAGMVDAAVGISLLTQRRFKQAGWLLGSGLGAGVLVLPQLWALGQRTPGLPGTSERAGLPEVFESANFRGGLHHGADLLDPWLPGPLTGGEGEVSHTAYIGVAVLLLAGWSWWRDRSLWPWILGALAMASLSLGPYLYLRGELLTIGDRVALGPAGFLLQALPPLGRLSRWYRAGAVASFLLLVPLLRLSRGAPWRALAIGGVVLCDLLLLAPLQWPLHHHPLPQALPAGGPLLELPAFTADLPPKGAWRDHSALSHTLHGRPVPGSFMKAPSQQASVAVHTTRRLARSGTLSERDLQVLRAQGWTQLVVYPHLVQGRPIWREHLTRCLGEPVLDSAEAVLWDLGQLERCR